jgi:ABC-type lipoprotein export system ATPase subunit
VRDVLIAGGVSRWFATAGGRLHAVRGVSLRVGEAELVAVVGRSGAGTTALLSMCGGLAPPDGGHVFVMGQDVAGMAGRRREAFLRDTVGWVPQRPALLSLLTVEENVAVVLRIAGIPERDAGRAARVALEAVGLRQRAATWGGELSMAERRRAAVARALVKAPALLIADQPTAHMDPRATGDVLRLLREAADSGAAVLYATQDETAVAGADRVLFMEAGALSER